jgi:hypothetical protein
VNSRTAHDLLTSSMIEKIGYFTKLFQFLWQRSCVMSDFTMDKSVPESFNDYFQLQILYSVKGCDICNHLKRDDNKSWPNFGKSTIPAFMQRDYKNNLSWDSNPAPPESSAVLFS